MALDRAQNLNREGFRYDSDIERIGVISEFVAFEIHLCDRIVDDALDYEERSVFVNALGNRFADHMQDNLTDLGGPRDYRGAFIALLNDRLADYAGFSLVDGKPGFDFLRYLGAKVQDVLGSDQTNRWVLDQIVAVEAPQVAETVTRSVNNLLAGTREDAGPADRP